MNERNVYLDLEMSTGKLYQYSNVEQDGYTKHVGVNPQTKKESVSYRKYYTEGIVGALKGLSIRETNFGKKLSLALWHDVEEKMYFITLPLFDQNKSISSFATSVIRYSPNLSFDEVYRIYPYVVENEYKGQIIKKYGVSIKWSRTKDNAVDNINAIPMLSVEKTTTNAAGEKEIIKGDVPMKEWEENIDGTPVANTKKRDKYLWEVLNSNLIEYVGTGTKTPTFNSKEDVAEDKKPEEKQKPVRPSTDFENTPAVAEVDEDDEDDEELPF